VKIAPDYFGGKVNWTIPNVSSEPVGAGLHLTVGELHMVSDFKKGAFERMPVMPVNKPVMYVGTLNDNQRTPVFAIGYRITPKEELTNQQNQ